MPLLTALLLMSALVPLVPAVPQAGRWTLNFNASHEFAGLAKNAFNGSSLSVRIECSYKNKFAGSNTVKVGWILRETQCWHEFAILETQPDAFSTYYDPQTRLDLPGYNTSVGHFAKSLEIDYECDGTPRPLIYDITPVQGGEVLQTQSGPKTDATQYIIPHDGDFLLVLHVQGQVSEGPFKATAEVEIKAKKGYLSVTDFPLLVFYGCMCVAYVLMGITWLILCSLHWRDLLRIQFWIGGVILLGMLEKAMFLAEYENVNVSGVPTPGLILAAELVSCAKRTLARMLVIIVSLGFGIVKPRLGPALHRVLGTGLVYFVVASTEAYFRTQKPKNDTSSATIIVNVPLSVIESSICWWIFSALLQTTRTLRLRRNVVKLALYRNFTNTLFFAVITSVIFMMWSIKFHKYQECLKDWRELWVDEAFWHLLFSFLLCVIMFLWRPSQNNQRYAFTPLLDYEEDEESEPDPDDPFYKGKVQNRSKSPKDFKDSKDIVAASEDPLKWIEENIPESVANPLPVLDSDEELETTRLEINKTE